MLYLISSIDWPSSYPGGSYGPRWSQVLSTMYMYLDTIRDTIRLCYVRNYWIKMRTNKPSAENTSVNGTTSDPTSPWRNLCYVSSRSSRAAAKMSVGRVKNKVKIPKWVHMYGITTQRGRLKILLSSPWMHANCADAARTREIGSRYCPILH